MLPARSRPSLAPVAPLFALAMASCAPPPEEPPPVAGIRSALNGTFSTLSCDQPAVDKLFAAMTILADKVIDHPQPLLDCLGDAVLNSTGPGFVERIRDDLASNFQTTVACDDTIPGGGPGALSGALGLRDDLGEMLVIKNDHVHDASPVVIAGTLLHEIAHDHTYGHSKIAGSGSHERRYVPQQVDACLESIVNNSPNPNGTRLSQVPVEAQLAHVGADGGGVGRTTCPDAAMVTELKPRSGDVVNQLAFGCRGLVELGAIAGSTFTSPAVGGSGGAPPPAPHRCEADEVAIGAYGRAGQFIDQIGLICASLGDLKARAPLTARQVTPAVGGNGGTPWRRQCPKGMALWGALTRAGESVDRVQLLCRNVDVPFGYSEVTLAPFGKIVDDNPREDQHVCGGNAVLTTLGGGSGEEVDRITGICQPLVCPVGTRCALDGTPFPLDVAGGLNGAGFADEACPANQALVGLRFRAGDRVDAIQGLCADVNQWLSGVNTFTPLGAGLHGGSGGSAPANRMCQTGTLLAGWKAGTVDQGDEPFGISQYDDTRRVSQLSLICRAPGVIQQLPSNAGTPAWVAGKTYYRGGRVTFGGKAYVCQQDHTSQVGWEPPNTPALWYIPTPPGIPTWAPQTLYVVSSRVRFNTKTYEAIQRHISTVGAEPAVAPALWRLVTSF